MSTRSAIITKTEKGYAGIYCHFDGYPEGVGKTLAKHYTDPAKVSELIALGDISSLGEDIAKTVAYSRDRGEKLRSASQAFWLPELLKEFKGAGCEYFHVFEGGEWTCRDGHDNIARQIKNIAQNSGIPSNI